MTEAEMVFDSYKKLKQSNRYKEIIMEVPYLSRCIDMVLVDNSENIISIEFKLKNWKQAIKQARDHKLGVDKAYICLPIPKRGISDALVDELSSCGIGLYLYSDSEHDLIEAVPAREITNHWEPYVDSLKDLINRISENNVFSNKQ